MINGWKKMSGSQMVFWQNKQFMKFLIENRDKKTVFNLNIDDLTPYITDCVDALFHAYYLFPEIKIDAFIIPNYFGEYDIRKYPLWVEQIKHLVKYKGLNLCLHGYEHDFGNDKNGTEFAGLTEKQCFERLRKGANILKEVGLKIDPKVFRPPRWRTSSNLLRAARKLGFEIICPSWREKPRRIWSYNLDVIYNNFYYVNNPIYPTEGDIGKEVFRNWYRFTNQIVCHAHFGDLAYDCFRQAINS